MAGLQQYIGDEAISKADLKRKQSSIFIMQLLMYKQQKAI
jgi:hypothetical protein